MVPIFFIIMSTINTTTSGMVYTKLINQYNINIDHFDLMGRNVMYFAAGVGSPSFVQLVAESIKTHTTRPKTYKSLTGEWWTEDQFKTNPDNAPPSPLFYAFERKKLDSLKQLIKLKANLYCPFGQVYNLLSIALQHSMHEDEQVDKDGGYTGSSDHMNKGWSGELVKYLLSDQLLADWNSNPNYFLDDNDNNNKNNNNNNNSDNNNNNNQNDTKIDDKNEQPINDQQHDTNNNNIDDSDPILQLLNEKSTNDGQIPIFFACRTKNYELTELIFKRGGFDHSHFDDKDVHGNYLIHLIAKQKDISPTFRTKFFDLIISFHTQKQQHIEQKQQQQQQQQQKESNTNDSAINNDKHEQHQDVENWDKNITDKQKQFEKSIYELRDGLGRTPLLLLSQQTSFFSEFKRLVDDYGCDLNTKTTRNDNLLHTAIVNPHDEFIVQKLFQSYGDQIKQQLFEVNKEGMTPFLAALDQCSTDQTDDPDFKPIFFNIFDIPETIPNTVSTLVEQGSNLFQKSNNNSTMFHLITGCNNLAVLEFLMDEAVDHIDQCP
jgi:hypothetical protein